MDAHEAASLKEDLFSLTGFLLTSASGLYHEPGEYGTHRLLNAAGRLLAIMDAHGLSDDFLRQLLEQIEAENAESMDAERQRETVDRLVMEYAGQLEHHLAGQ